MSANLSQLCPIRRDEHSQSSKCDTCVKKDNWHNKKYQPASTGPASYLAQNPACSLWWWVFTLPVLCGLKASPSQTTPPKALLLLSTGKCANLASAKHPAASTNGWLFWVITINISVFHSVTKAKFKETTTMTWKNSLARKEKNIFVNNRHISEITHSFRTAWKGSLLRPLTWKPHKQTKSIP